MSHTPGPWELNPLGLDRESNQVYASTLKTGQRRLVAIVATGQNTFADGSLIAAAPSMLLALKALFDAANHFHVHDKWFTDVDRNREILMNAEAAIAKAEGKE